MAVRALTFEQLLDRMSEDTGDADVVSVRDLLNAVGRRAYGPILLLFGFVALSPLTFLPGANWLMALIIFLVAIQIVLGAKTPWLPKNVLNASFPRKYLHDAVTIGRPWARRVDWFTRPRLSFLTEAPFIQVVAVACVASALITFPLGLFPLGPVLPSLAVFLFGVGLAARDGIFLMLSGCSLAGAVYVLYRLGGRVAEVFHNLFPAIAP